MSTDLPVSRTGATDREVENRAFYAWMREDGEAGQWPAFVGGWDAARAAAAPDSRSRQTNADRLLIQRNNRFAAEVADRYFARDEEEWGQLHTDVLDALTGELTVGLPAALLAEQPGGGR